MVLGGPLVGGVPAVVGVLADNKQRSLMPEKSH